MSISDNYEPTKDLANGTTLIYTADWDPLNTDYVEIYSEDYTTGVQTEVTTGFTAEILSTGSLKVTFDVAPGDATPADSVYIILSRATPNSQEVPFTTSSGFQAKVAEGVWDKAVAMLQEVVEGFARALSYPIGTSSAISKEIPAPVAGKAIKGNSSGDGWVNTTLDPDEAAAEAETSAAAALVSENNSASSESSASDDATATAADVVSTNDDVDTINAIVADGGIVKGEGTVNPNNLLSNGDFEAWSAGTSSAPDGWMTPSTIARSTNSKIGSYSAGLTRSGSSVHIVQTNLHTEKGIDYWKGKTVTLGAWVYSSEANNVRISSNDGKANHFSSYHTGDSTWQWLSVTATLSDLADRIDIYNMIESTDETAYFDGEMLVEGESAFAFSPKPIPIGYLDTDDTLAANSDTKIPTQKAVKAYVDAEVKTMGAIVSKADNSASEATTDGFFYGSADFNSSQLGYVYIDDTDATTEILKIGVVTGGATGTTAHSFCIPVKSGQFYKANLSAGTNEVLWFTPLN